MEILEPKQQKALLALLKGLTRQQAAKEAGISEATIYKYLAEEKFRKVLRAERQKLFELGCLEVSALISKANEALKRSLDCGDNSIELRAAQIVINASFKSEDLAVLSAIERLEELHKGKAL